MCGKFTQTRNFEHLVRLSDLLLAQDGENEPCEIVTPMRFAHVVALDGKGQRKTVRMRWGLVPADSPDPAAAKPHIHARAETADSKPTFRDAFAKRRGLVMVSSFNEGREVTSTRTEQYVLTPRDAKPMAIAIVWECWRGSDLPLLTFAMVTVPANPLIATITDRMPALIEDAGWAKWLGEQPATPEELKAILRPSGRDLIMQRAGKPSRPSKDIAQGNLF